MWAGLPTSALLDTLSTSYTCGCACSEMRHLPDAEFYCQAVTRRPNNTDRSTGGTNLNMEEMRDADDTARTKAGRFVDAERVKMTMVCFPVARRNHSFSNNLGGRSPPRPSFRLHIASVHPNRKERCEWRRYRH